MRKPINKSKAEQDEMFAKIAAGILVMLFLVGVLSLAINTVLGDQGTVCKTASAHMAHAMECK